MDDENFHLKWESFESNTISAFKGLIDNTSFHDVTLVSEDDHEIGAHKVVLSASSVFFMQILGRSWPFHQPLVFLKGVQGRDLKALLRFMYLGETEVGQEDITSFLQAGLDLQVSGIRRESLSVAKEDKSEENHETNLDINEEQEKTLDQFNSIESGQASKEGQIDNIDTSLIKDGQKQVSRKREFPCKYCDYKGTRTNHITRHMYKVHSIHNSKIVDHRKDELDIYSKIAIKIKEETLSQIEMTSLKKYECSECPAKFTRGDHLKRHIFGGHTNEKLTCDECSYASKRKESMKHHKYIHHQ